MAEKVIELSKKMIYDENLKKERYKAVEKFWKKADKITKCSYCGKELIKSKKYLYISLRNKTKTFCDKNCLGKGL